MRRSYMPRTKRNFGTKEINHCIIRGINKRDLFFDNQDRYKFLKCVKEFKFKYKIKIGTFCLMPNHIHLLMQGEDEDISGFFRSMQISYATYFNKKYDRVGHLFQNRFKNKIVQDLEYLKNVVKYIHYNPEKANIARATDYQWSSYKEFFKNDTWIDKKMVLEYYDSDEEKALKIFEEQHKSELSNYYTNYPEYEIIEKLTDEEVKNIIDEKKTEFLKLNSTKLKEEIEDEVIKDILHLNGVSINQVSRVTGISRKLLKKLKEN